MASQERFNHTAPCAVKRAGIADHVTLDRFPLCERMKSWLRFWNWNRN